MCEELARWIALRRFARTARGWKAAILFGAGHGGVEAFMLGVLAATSAIVMAVMVHLAAATLVMRAVMSRRVVWLWMAILFHTAVDAVAVYALKRWGELPVEALMVPFAVLAAVIVALERRRESRAST